MALPDKTYALRDPYVLDELTLKRGALDLVPFPGAPGTHIVVECRRNIGMAVRGKRPRSPYQTIRKRLGVGTILTSRWIAYTSRKSLEAWKVIEKRSGVENETIEIEGVMLLRCLMHVDDLPHFLRMQYHIIDEKDQGYDNEYTHLATALNELERICLTLTLKLTKDAKETIAATLAQIESMFEWCLNHHKRQVVENARELQEKIKTIYGLADFGERLRKMMEHLKQREYDVNVVSPFVAARQKAGQNMARMTRNRLYSALGFVEHCIEYFEIPRTNAQLKTLVQAFQSQAASLRNEVLCQPFRTPARRAAAPLARIAENWGQSDNTCLRDLRFARGHLQRAINNLILCNP